MTDFIASVAASLLAGILLVVITALASQRARWVLTGLLGRLLDVDVDVVFSDKTTAQSDVQREIKRAHTVAILTGRGSELQRDTFDPLFLHRPAARNVRVRILLPKTAVAPGEHDWTLQRETELARFDAAFGKGLLREQIEANARFFQEYVATGKMELRRFQHPHIGRIVLTDRCAYYTPYRNDSHGRDCPVYKFRRGDMYDNLQRLFDQLWEAASET
jgi:hypothetical protein